jgi:hypothetical protein
LLLRPLALGDVADDVDRADILVCRVEDGIHGDLVPALGDGHLDALAAQTQFRPL